MATTTAQVQGPQQGRGDTTYRPSRYEAPTCPPVYGQADRDRFVGWMQTAINEGRTFLEGQQGYRFVPASYRLMSDRGLTELPSTLSNASMNFVKRDVRELVATLANPRPIASFRCENPEYARQADVLNKCYLSWYNTSFVDRKLRAALQYAATEGTGYLMIDWDPAFWGTGHGDIRLTPLGVDNVYVVGISPDDWDLQRAYAVVIERQMPTVEVLRRFPEQGRMIRPDGEARSRWRRFMDALSGPGKVATVMNTYGRDRGYRDIDPTSRAVTTVYDIYIQDASVNRSGETMLMGQAGSPWAYSVPSLGSDIPTGVNITDAMGNTTPVMRKADWHDARLYPYRRHVVATNLTVLSDGPSRFWHGQVPIVKFTLDDWPQEYCGIPVTKEPAKLQAAATSLLRAYDDCSNARLRPPMTYDQDRVSDELARSVDCRVGGQTIGVSNVMGGQVFQLAVPPEIYNLDGGRTLEIIQWMRQQGKQLMGLADMENLAEAAQIPSGDTVEKLTELAGPLATDMSRNMESSLSKLGHMFMCNVFEFYTARRRFQLLGPDGLTREDYDYFDPNNLVPADVNLPGVLPTASRAERARAHMANFQFSIVPNSIYGITQSSRKMLLIQLARMGFPISPWTVMEACDVPNPGKPPVGAVTETLKFWAWKKEEVENMTEIQMLGQQAMMQANPAMAIAAMAQQAMGGNGGQGGPGRKPSGQEAPRQEEKRRPDGSTDTVIAES